MSDVLLYKRNLLSWHGSFVGEEVEESLEGCCLMLVLDLMKESNSSLEDVELSVQAIKSSFLM